MKIKLPFLAALAFATLLVVGCGDDLSSADKAWVKQKRFQEMYGISGTVTTTGTATVTVHTTQTTTQTLTR